MVDEQQWSLANNYASFIINNFRSVGIRFFVPSPLSIPPTVFDRVRANFVKNNIIIRHVDNGNYWRGCVVSAYTNDVTLGTLYASAAVYNSSIIYNIMQYSEYGGG